MRLLHLARSSWRGVLAFRQCSDKALYASCKMRALSSAASGDRGPLSSSTTSNLASYRAAIKEAVEGGQGIITAFTMFERLDKGMIPGLTPDDAMVEEVLNLCIANLHTRPLLPTLRRWLPKGLKMQPSTYLAALQALCRKKRHLDVVAYLSLLRKHQVEGRVECYAAAVNLVKHQPTRLRILTEWVEDEGIAADDALLCSVIQNMTKWQQWGPTTSVKAIVEALAAQGVDSKQYKRSLALGLKYFGNHGMWEEGLGTLQTLLKMGDKLDLNLATSALVACARAGEEDACSWIYQRIVDEGLPVDDRVLTALVMLPSERREWEGIVRAMRAFREKGVAQTTWATNVAVRGLGNSDKWPVALWIYEEALVMGLCDAPMVRSLMEALPVEQGGMEAIAAPLLQSAMDNNVFHVWKRPWVCDLHRFSTRMARAALPVLLERAARMHDEAPQVRHDLHIITGWRTNRPGRAIGGGQRGTTGDREPVEGLRKVVQDFCTDEMGVRRVEWVDSGTVRILGRDIQAWWERRNRTRWYQDWRIAVDWQGPL